MSWQAAFDDKRKFLLNTLQNELHLQENYHNHKEKMAWTAVSLFAGFTVLFIGRIVTIESDRLTILFNKHIDFSEVVLFAVLVAMFLSTIIFLNMQFRARWNSADTSEVFYRYLYRMQLLDSNSIENLLHIENINSKGSIYPDEIMKELRILHSKRSIASIVCALPLLFCRKTDERFKTEIPSYVIAFILLCSQILTVIALNFM